MESSAEGALSLPEQSHSASLIRPAVHVTLTKTEDVARENFEKVDLLNYPVQGSSRKQPVAT